MDDQAAARELLSASVYEYMDERGITETITP